MKTLSRFVSLIVVPVVSSALAIGCAQPEPEGLRPSDPGTGATVKFDLFAKPLPEIPFPNDLATRYDPTSPTGRRINASMVATTAWETTVRKQLDQLDGWGTFAAIAVPFSRPLDVEVFYERHRDDYDFRNDAVYVVDVTPDSPDFCKAVPLDMGEGNFPYTLERTSYYPNDPRNDANTIVFEEFEEDLNGNGQLDPGEDTDMDGVLDHPNLRRPDGNPFEDMMTFYERETNTLLMRPLMPLRERTRYAAVITRRVLDETGRPVRSPFPYINHTAQTGELAHVEECMGNYGVALSDVAFTWSFTTQSITGDFKGIRDGLYGLGTMGWLEDTYPAQLTKIMRLRKDKPNVYVVPGEELLAVAKDLLPQIAGGSDDPTVMAVLESHQFIGHHVVFQFESPQFFPRHDESGKLLPLYDQVWQVNPQTGEAFHRPETITVWLTVPRKELVKDGGPAPVVIMGHGYTGNKLDPLLYGGFFARHGVAAIGVECVSHGIGLNEGDAQIAKAVFQQKGLEGMITALMQHRAFDQNGDDIEDSGADFWSAYAFHTRDVVRQSAVDYMQLIRILKTFDGQRTGDVDLDGDGKKELAGDFDGDGVVDVGGNASISFSGGSLGGIMGTILGGAEPQLDTTIPIAGGGGLIDIGARSTQGGVAEAVNLRMFGPLLLSLWNAEKTELQLWQYLPDLNNLGRVQVGTVNAAKLTEGDTLILRNLRSGEYRCGRVQKDGLFRLATSSDDGDALRLEFYKGPLPSEARTGCYVPAEIEPYETIDSLGVDVEFQARQYAKGSPLVALGDGYGLRRSSPETRRFMAIAQIILDPADPVNFAPFFENRLLEYGTGEQVRTRALVLNTIGDMNVPMSTGASISRAAGFVPFTERDSRWNRTPNQVLIDTGALEATERTRRHLNGAGSTVLMDVEHLALLGDGQDGYDVPRLSPPLRLIGPSSRVGGVTGTLFPFVKPTGKHGFDPPDHTAQFDLGALMVNVIGRYVSTEGRELELDACQVSSTCAWIPPPIDVP